MNNTIQSLDHPGDIGLGEIARVLRRRGAAFAAVLLLCLALAALATHAMHKKWRATAQMALIEHSPNAEAPKDSYAPPVVETVDTQVAMLQSDGMTQRTLDWLRANVGPHDPRVDVATLTAQKLGSMVAVSNPKDTDVLQVTADAPSRAEAALLADATCRAFLLWKRDLARRQVADIASSLQVRAAGAQAQMRQAERRERDFKQRWHMADVAAQEKSLLDQYQARDAEAHDLQKEEQSLNARLGELEKQLQAKNARIGGSGGVRDDALVTSLQSQLNQLEMDRADAAQKYTAKYPGMLSGLDAKIKDTKARLDAAIHGILSGNLTSLQSQSVLLDDDRQTQVSAIYTAAKLAAATRMRGQLQAQLAQMPKLDAEYKQITRNVALSNQLYLSLQSSLDEARLDAEIATGAVQIMQPAVVPLRPFRPNTAQNLVLGGLAGLFLASLTVVVLEGRDRRVRDRADVLRLTQGVVLGALPPLSKTDARALASGATPALVSESYRRAYANLLLALHQAEQTPLLHRALILVTSAVAGEGKSTTAAGLAHAIAGTGKRTILVEAGRPAPHAGEPYGLSDVLRGNALLEEALAVTEHPNLLRLGPGYSRPDEGLALPALEPTLHALRRHADIVIVDAPASMERADAFFLAPMADCIVQVIGVGRVDEAALRQTSDGLSAARPRLMAHFLNYSPEGNWSRVSSPTLPPPAPALPAAGRALGALSDAEATAQMLAPPRPARGPLLRLGRPAPPPPAPHAPAPEDVDVTWLHLEDHVRGPRS